MDEKDCKVLLIIFEEQNLSKAAERLYITQPALTYRIRQLEKQFQMQIVQKTGKNIKFTSEGKQLVDYARKSLQEEQRFKELIINLKSEIQGTLRLGASGHFTQYKLAPILQQFMEQHPKIQIVLNTTTNQEIFQALENGSVHVGIVRGEFNWIDQKYLISEDPFYIISKKEIELDHLPVLHRINYRPSTLPLNKFGYKPDTYLMEVIEGWWKDRFNIPPLITINVNNYETCKQLVKHGLGYSIVPQICLNSEDSFYKYPMIFQNGQPLVRKTWLIYKESSLELNLVNEFVNYIKSSNLHRSVY
ncbi:MULTISPECIES: LysR family transcriptional regulator [Paenibacillus]|uniref:LysR family transcriptional regulator n=1 Tax=Paenibacillus radicis (ex Xue et al. 2023) TaxID=2972489 RepID=A0ABT1YT50_9BACL|nr:LysR family transcriptional regulator [Paenibacillus radicis (ex Xue et al. 2023)]MCR8635160.1 LysR family transcriptional regulator [Paenibacillus radicis (ex Xue et al. 2023)]